MSSRSLSFGGDQTTELSMSLVEHKCIYTLPSNSISKLLKKNLPGIIQAGFASQSHANETSRYEDFTGPLLLQKLVNNGDTGFEQIESAFSNISSILTAWIRTHGSETASKDAIGQAFQSSTCLQVQWAWLAFPATLSILDRAVISPGGSDNYK